MLHAAPHVFRRLSLAAAAALVVATGCPAPAPAPDAGPDDRGDDVEAALDLARPERLTRELSADAMNGRDEDTAGGRAARALLVEELTACGVAPLLPGGYEQPITTGSGANVLGVVPGTSNSDRVIIVSAHYDHLGAVCGGVCNGALDNAGSVGAVVAAACAVAAAPVEKTVVVALWDAEEPPTFLSAAMGSRFFVDQLEDGALPFAESAVDVALVLDLTGGELWPGYGTHFALGDDKTAALSAAFDDVALPAGLPVLRGGLHLIEELPTGRQPWSDYDAFRNRGVPTLFFSDGQNKRYHQANDDADGLNFVKLLDETRLVARLVEAVAASSEPFAFEAGAGNLARDRQTILTLLDDALAPGGFVDALGLSSQSRDQLQGVRDDGAASDEDAPPAALLRGGAQLVMCLAGDQYSESQCNLFF